MTTLVCFDPETGILRRYTRGVREVVCTGKAQFDPWKDLPPEKRVVPLDSLEAFRLQAPVSDAPRAA